MERKSRLGLNYFGKETYFHRRKIHHFSIFIVARRIKKEISASSRSSHFYYLQRNVYEGLFSETIERCVAGRVSLLSLEFSINVIRAETKSLPTKATATTVGRYNETSVSSFEFRVIKVAGLASILGSKVELHGRKEAIDGEHLREARWFSRLTVVTAPVSQLLGREREREESCPLRSSSAMTLMQAMRRNDESQGRWIVIHRIEWKEDLIGYLVKGMREDARG